MSWNSKVVWSEGMFLQPQHLQQHDRHIERLIQGRTQPIAGHAWGYVALVVDEAALALGKLALSRARGILPDGTPFDLPGDDVAPLPLDVAPDIRDELIVLALPLRRPGTLEADVAGEDTIGLTRYQVSELDVADSTLASAPTAPVQVGDLRLKLMPRRDATDAYATLGVVRVVERRADNQLVLDKAYIPPTLACSGNPILAGYVRELLGLLHQRGEALGARLSQPGRGGVAEIADFLLLQTVNRHEPVFRQFDDLPLLHPAVLYGHCLMLAGDLCAFSRESRRPPDYPL
ncbi:MAG: type VI secretion system baseplate subunit TssK, partial [Proteobacteria bacterium]|nr:type VI secretion system baseplate subunit TssK [Pseudomonadota bacterium]